jgi:indoleacetamide hydrolase
MNTVAGAGIDSFRTHNPALVQAHFETARARAAEINESGAFISLVSENTTETYDGPLSGVPFAVKDNIDTEDLPTTGGTGSFSGSIPKRDAVVVQRLRSAGACLVGKTSLHELAFGITSNNARFGPIVNPHDPRRSAGGSSGGSAVAVASNVVPFALATDTGGSARIPASHCGVVGFRPTAGRWPCDGVMRISSTRDTVGVIANTVEDVALVDTLVAKTGPTPEWPRPSDQVRLGVPRDGFYDDLDPHIDRCVSLALSALEDAGYDLVEVPLQRAIVLDGQCGLPIVLFEAPRELLAYAQTLRAPFNTLTYEDIIAGAESRDVRSVLELAGTNPFSFHEYEDFLATRLELQHLYSGLFNRTGIDALVYPTVPLLPSFLGEDDTTLHNGRQVPVFASTIRNTGPGSIAGLPALSLPIAHPEGTLPVGLSVEGGTDTDQNLLLVGAAIAKACGDNQTQKEMR